MKWLALALALAACDQRAIVGETPDGGANNENWADVSLGTRTADFDILFVIDNSPSMSPKQAELKSRFSQLADQLDQFATAGNPGHYHIGVITTDLGAAQFTLGGGQCHPGGDKGAMVALGPAADPSCQPPVNHAWIDFDQLHGENNLPAGQDLSKTFACMASVGDRGCGFEMPLESAYQALHDPVPGVNQGFLRDDSALAIIFVTDEDDCSAPPDGDLFDPSKVAQYGALLSFRCTQFGVVCDGAALPYGSSGGPLANCAPAPGGLLYGVDRYLDFFTRPGGVRANPADVLLFSLAAPPQPFEIITANPQAPSPGPYVPCTGAVDGMQCAVVLQHSCTGATPDWFGDPAVRLDAVVSQSQVTSNQTSICSNSYLDAMQQLGHALVSYQNGYGCLPGRPPDPNDPRCVVEDDTLNPDGTVTATPVPSCLESTDGRCWRVDPYPFCTGVDATGAPTVHLQLTVQPPGSAPPNTSTRARCVVVTGG
jgi:hypothetical protein